MAYPLDYLTLDELGMKEVKCMVCGKTIGARSFVSMPSREDPTKKINVLAFKRLSSWRQRKLIMEIDGVDMGFVEPMVCVDCESVELDPDKVKDQIVHGWELEMGHAGKSQTEIADRLKKMKASKIKLKKGEK